MKEAAAPVDQPVVRGVSLTRTYNQGRPYAAPVLSGVDIQVARGESLAVMGPSGSGKTTLLNILGTLDRPDDGEVVLEGLRTSSLDHRSLARLRNRRIGFVFQQHHLLPHLTALENVLLPASLPGAGGTVHRARDLLDRVGLGGREEAGPGELSGGERQRVAVVRALINRPSILLCDEPTGSLDHETAVALGNLLFEVVEGEGLAMVLVTHSVELGARARRRVLLKDGRLSPPGP